jgi:hypothetical protein
MVFRTAHVLDTLTSALSSKTSATHAAALTLVSAICDIARAPAEPYLIPFLPTVLTAAADKSPDVHSAALLAGRALVHNMCPFGARYALPHVTAAMIPTARWQQKYAACVILRDILTSAPDASAASLPQFFPPLRDLMTDAREEVREAALAAMQITLSLVGNRDLEPLLQVCFPARRPLLPLLWCTSWMATCVCRDACIVSGTCMCISDELRPYNGNNTTSRDVE